MTYHASEINIRLKRKVSRSGRISGLFDFKGFQKIFLNLKCLSKGVANLCNFILQRQGKRYSKFSGHHIVRLSRRLLLARHELSVNPGSKWNPFLWNTYLHPLNLKVSSCFSVFCEIFLRIRISFDSSISLAYPYVFVLCIFLCLEVFSFSESSF